MKKKQAEQLPDNLRCRKTDGRKWRCYKRVMEGKKWCEVHYPKTLTRNRKPKEPQPLPDDLRCNRNDGRKWRCERRVMDGLKLCEAHHLQSQLRSNREEVPEALKMKRRRKVGDLGDSKRKLKKKKRLGVFEEKMSLKKGDLHFELMRVFLKRQMEGRKKKWNLVSGFGGGELVRDLPNGLMAISPVSLSGFSNIGFFSEKKLEMGSGLFVQHCFRSKNVEVPRIGPLQVVSCGGNVIQSIREGKMNCHRGGRRDDGGIVQCSSCQRESLCLNCIGECDNCGTFIVDFHRSCSSHSYGLCLQCCQEIRCGNLPGGIRTSIFEFINRGKAYMHGGKPLLDMKTKEISAFKKRCFNTSLVCSTTVPNWKANTKDGRIFCPPREFGGCGKHILDLRCVLRWNWTEECEVSAHEIACIYEISKSLDASCCPFCIVGEFDWILLPEKTDDNYLYCPTLSNKTGHLGDLEPFQIH